MFESHLKQPISFPTLTGSIVTFNSQYAGLPLKSCVSQISGYQEGSGTPSPSNVRQLVSFSSGTLNKTGKNLVNININTSQYSGTYNFGKTLFGTFTLSAKKNDVVLSEAVWIVRIDYADGTYAYCGDEGYSNPFPCVIDATVKGIKSITWRSFGITSGSYDLMFELGSTASPYEPFGNTYTFTFGQSIYQGSTDWKRGVVTAKWGYIASYNGETLTGEWLCNKAPYEVGTTPPTASQVAYELATPIEIPLGGINLLTQEGQNNIWADTGDTTLQYIKLG